ncbi:MAG TPA: SCO family protein [Pirellulales bacterium]|nr:SCO family protein [Pirellulales bacterium]
MTDVVIAVRRGVAKALPQPPAVCRSFNVWLRYPGYSLLAFLSLLAVASAQRPFGTDAYRAPANQGQVAGLVSQIGIDQRLGEQLPLDLELRDETGQTVKLGDYFREQPVVLMLVYYRCPMLCTQVANGFLKSSQAIKYAIGHDYQVVTVSFDPRETTELAAEKKASYVRAYRREGAAAGWHFLTGDEEALRRLTESVGFRYRYDPKSDQYAHASGIMVATPDGKLSRYFYGIEYEPSYLRMALIESSQGRIGTPVEKVLLMCFHYDPLTGKYGLAIAAALRLGGALTMLLLGGFLIAMYRKERRRSRAVRDETVLRENEFALSGTDGIASS